MNIEEVLENIKRHLDYVNATKQKSIRDTEIEVMYKEIERLNSKWLDEIQKEEEMEEWARELHSIIKEVREKIRYWQQDYMGTYISTDELDELLEILDKESQV